MLNGAAPTNTTLTNATAGVLGAALPALGSSRGSSGVTGKFCYGCLSIADDLTIRAQIL